MGSNSLMDGFDCGIDPEFHGRSRDLNKLQSIWDEHRMIGVFGIRAVGKSRLVKEFVRRQEQTCPKLRIVYIDLTLQTTLQSLYAYICADLGITPEVFSRENGKWKRQICREISKRTRRDQLITMAMVFDNAEHFLESEEGNDLESLLECLIRFVKRTKVFITSTTKVLLTKDRNVSFSYELLPLPEGESLALLQSSTNNVVEFGRYRNDIIHLSEGLPLLIQMIGGELMEDGGLLTPADMAELLKTCRLETLSREFYPEEDRIADVYKRFIERLPPHYKNAFATLEYIPGSFRTAEAWRMLDEDDNEKDRSQVLVALRRRSMLTFDTQTHRLNIQGILRECCQKFFQLKNISEVRRRYFITFSPVMQGISQRLDTEDSAKGMSEFIQEQPNLQKLLSEVVYSKEDTYHFFIEIATNCTAMIENFMPENGEKFYKEVLRSTEIYGNAKEMNIVLVSLGIFYTKIKCDFSEGLKLLKRAVRHLETGPRDIHLATAYQRRGWNLHCQDKTDEAIGYFEKSLDISCRLGKPAELLMLQTLNSLGIANTVLGNFSDAHRYHFRSLELRRRIQGPHHTAVGSTINNIGHYYSRKGEPETAFKYCNEGLEIKRRSQNTRVMSFVDSYNNLASELVRTKQFDKAHEQLDEAMKLLNAEAVPPRDGIAETHATKGKVFRAEKKYGPAAQEYKKAMDIWSSIVPNGRRHVETMVQLASIYCWMGKYDKSLNLAERAVALTQNIRTMMPLNTTVIECLAVLAEVYRFTNNDEKYTETVGKLESELMFLEGADMQNPIYTHVDEMRSQFRGLNLICCRNQVSAEPRHTLHLKVCTS